MNPPFRTESVIQSVIKKNFGDSTVITIAHRLDTIIKCDRVLVLDAGNAVVSCTRVSV